MVAFTLRAAIAVTGAARSLDRYQPVCDPAALDVAFQRLFGCFRVSRKIESRDIWCTVVAVLKMHRKLRQVGGIFEFNNLLHRRIGKPISPVRLGSQAFGNLTKKLVFLDAYSHRNLRGIP